MVCAVEELVEKQKTRPTTTKSTKPKGKVEGGPSTKTNRPAANTRKDATRTRVSGSNTIPKRPRRKTTVPRVDIQKGSKKGDTSQVDEEGAHVMMSGVQP